MDLSLANELAYPSLFAMGPKPKKKGTAALIRKRMRDCRGMTHLKLRLACEVCYSLTSSGAKGDGYTVQKPEAWLVHAAPCLNISLKVSR